MKNSEEVFGGSRCVTDPRQARRIRDPVEEAEAVVMEASVEHRNAAVKSDYPENGGAVEGERRSRGRHVV
ncbi:hypothetical protein Bca52824_052463 [Brassica carinata]|uniref:Uncharacterized protein n=1 Tax=Brassica carinata TaxID=52824 RepID=A0A8X7R249_BRACI|nr:hypothetical protein Bca52824_052463 [Brassica carinata]